MKASRMVACALLGASLALPVHAQPAGNGAAMGPGAGMGQGPRAKSRQFRFDRGNTYGWSLMSKEERAEHRQKMLAAKTFDECKAVQSEQHAQMEARAKAKGMKLHAPRQNACDRMKARGLLK